MLTLPCERMILMQIAECSGEGGEHDEYVAQNANRVERPSQSGLLNGDGDKCGSSEPLLQHLAIGLTLLARQRSPNDRCWAPRIEGTTSTC